MSAVPVETKGTRPSETGVSGGYQTPNMDTRSEIGTSAKNMCDPILHLSSLRMVPMD